MEHLTQDDLEGFVLGEPPRDPEAFRRHVSSCATCAQRLAREARLEAALLNAGEADARATRSRPARVLDALRVPLGIAAALLLVTAAAWIFASRGGRREAPSITPALVAPERALRGHADAIARMPAYGTLAPPDVCRFTTVPRAASRAGCPDGLGGVDL